MDEKVMTVKEVSEVLRLSYWSVIRLIKRGELVSLKIGARRVVLGEDLREFLERRREAGLAATGRLASAQGDT